MVDWKNLLRSIALELDLDVDKETDLIAIAQYYFNEYGRDKINQSIIDAFLEDVSISDDQKILASLPIKTYWTTNYDKMIENAIKENGKVIDTKIDKENFTQTVPRRDMVLYKMHGDVLNPHKAVLTKDDYERYNEERQVFTTALQGDLLSKTFLFIGFSFDDPNLNHILSRIKILLGENVKTHYCFFRKISKDDCVDDDDYNYKRIQQELKIKDLKRYGIRALLINEYCEITEILTAIKDKIERRTIFISGAAEEYGKIDNARQLVAAVAYELVRRQNKIVSGFGKGFGDYVINGVLSYIGEKKQLDDYLILKPFPQDIVVEKIREETWTKYRKAMISNAGIALFFFGNKKKDEKIVESDGVYEEFQIALERGATVIPIGCTGYVAEELWKKVVSDMDTYYQNNAELRKRIKELGVFDSIKKLTDRIIEIIGLLQ